MTAQTHYMGVPVQSFTEPTKAERQANKHRLIKEREAELLAARSNKYFVLATGTLARTDIYGWRGHEACVVSDPGPAEAWDRRVILQKINGRTAGETVTVSRDRVSLPPGR